MGVRNPRGVRWATVALVITATGCAAVPSAAPATVAAPLPLAVATPTKPLADPAGYRGLRFEPTRSRSFAGVHDGGPVWVDGARVSSLSADGWSRGPLLQYRSGVMGRWTDVREAGDGRHDMLWLVESPTLPPPPSEPCPPPGRPLPGAPGVVVDAVTGLPVSCTPLPARAATPAVPRPPVSSSEPIGSPLTVLDVVGIGSPGRHHVASSCAGAEVVVVDGLPRPGVGVVAAWDVDRTAGRFTPVPTGNVVCHFPKD